MPETDNLSNVKIEYQCNKCHTKRIMFIPKSAIRVSKESGYIELYDFHRCRNNECTPTILFVDENLDVRAQTIINKEETDESPQSSLPIPVPKKVSMLKKEIPLNKDVSFQLVKGVQIIDKLRKTIFTLSSLEGQKILEVTSNTNNIKIIANVFVGLEESNTQLWLKGFANELETVVIFKIDILTYMIQYLNERLKEECTAAKLMEIDLLVNSGVIFLETTEVNLELYKSGWKKEFPKFSKNHALLGRYILSNALTNPNMNLLELINRIKNDYKKQNAAKFRISDLFEVLANLITKNLVIVNRAEFITIN